MADWNYKVFLDEALSQIHESFKSEKREQEFLMWFKVQYEESTENSIIISLPSKFITDQFKRRNYYKLLISKIKEISGQDLFIEMIVKPLSSTISTENKKNVYVSNSLQKTVNENVYSSPQNKQTKEYPIKKKQHPLLKEEYTFKSFVIGDNNSFAYNAAKAISKNPGKAYNPMLIYGGVGLGKTHLMEAIGNEIYETTDIPDSKIIYITAENFTNEFIRSIKGSDRNAAQSFKNKYRNADVLLIDDIHFLESKDGTQEELFHTFNALYDAKKQIIFTCDRPVSELKKLSDRLRSRFVRGLNVDLQPPNYETRHAILEKKLTSLGKQIPNDVIDLIAQNIATNVRDLEACLTKIIAYTDLVGKEVTLEIAQQQLRDTFSSPKQANISVDNIQRVVADYFNISISDLKGKKRTRNVTLPRQLAMYISRELTEYSTTELGIEFGGRDHSTVMHSCQKIEELLRSDSTLESTLQTLMRAVKDYKK
ncbi:MAG: chromosomal replication initiator protein DnaA [Treponema sp. CETP13]|nr:MAG: chromosomal replication initiator protein DnaA [Treponema sp. CETP13]